MVPPEESIIVVSGLPRSGTSMMMRTLAFGGLPILEDGERKSDRHNPYGYYEHQSVKYLAHDPYWIRRAIGHGVKVVAPLVMALPPGERYRIVFMTRTIEDVIRSQERLLEACGNEVSGPENLSEILCMAERDSVTWLEAQPCIDVLTVAFEAVFEQTYAECARVASFIKYPMNVGLMVDAVDFNLRRDPSFASRINH